MTSECPGLLTFVNQASFQNMQCINLSASSVSSCLHSRSHTSVTYRITIPNSLPAVQTSSFTMSSNNDQPSTLQSYVDSATGAVQNAFGALTGSSSDKAAGQNKKAEGQAKDDASHATLKLPGMTATASGVTADDSRRSEGSWNQTLGSGMCTSLNCTCARNSDTHHRKRNGRIHVRC